MSPSTRMFKKTMRLVSRSGRLSVTPIWLMARNRLIIEPFLRRLPQAWIMGSASTTRPESIRGGSLANDEDLLGSPIHRVGFHAASRRRVANPQFIARYADGAFRVGANLVREHAADIVHGHGLARLFDRPGAERRSGSKYCRRIFLGRALQSVVDFELGDVWIDDDLRILPGGVEHEHAFGIWTKELVLGAVGGH